MGVVYKARQVSLDRIVALKMILRATRANALDLARYRIEAEAAASLDHPHIVPIYEVGEHEGQPYFAMKYIDGPTLARRAREGWKAEVSRLEAVSRAVHYAHQRGILHRDLKPGNIQLDAQGRAYVADFGQAKQLDAGVSLTETNALLGTAGYISPEQARGTRGLTTATDTFGLGAMLYERLTGQAAFPGGTVLERLNALQTGATPRPTLHVPTLPRDLETICLKCLEREPGKRYATAEGGGGRSGAVLARRADRGAANGGGRATDAVGAAKPAGCGVDGGGGGIAGGGDGGYRCTSRWRRGSRRGWRLRRGGRPKARWSVGGCGQWDSIRARGPEL